jgi:hypothetical protein
MRMTELGFHCFVATRCNQWSALQCEYFTVVAMYLYPLGRRQSKLGLAGEWKIANPNGNGKRAFLSADNYLKLSQLIGYTQTLLRSVNYNWVDLRRMCFVGG